MRVLLAIKPRSYREALGEVIRVLKPHVEVRVIDPEELWEAVARVDPDLVFADRPDRRKGALRPAWAQFRPYEEPALRICLAGRWRELEGEVELDDLLSLVDETEELARTTEELGHC